MTLVGIFILSSTLLAGFLSPAHVLPIGTPAIAQDENVDVTGTWRFQVETAAGSGSPTLTFKQDGEKLTGRYKGLFGEADVSGTVKGKDITFSFKADAQGTEVAITYAGTVDKDTIKGKVTLGDLGEGTFTAKRQ